MRPFFIVAPGLVLAVVSAHAQDTQIITPPPAPRMAPVPSDEPEITLETLIQRARANNPRLEIARQNLEAAQGRAQSLRARVGPTLQLVPAIGGNREARDEEIVVAQPLDVFGARRARAEVGKAEARRAQAQSRALARTLEVEIRGAAALLFAAQEAESLDRAQVEIAELFRAAANRRAALGDVPQVQAQRAQLEFLRAQNDFAASRAARLTRRTQLNVLIGALPNAPLRVALPLDFRATATGNPRAEDSSTQSSSLETPNGAPATGAQIGGALVAPDAATLATRPDIAGAQAALDARRAEVRALRRERLPQVELQARRAPFLGRDGGGGTAIRAVVTVPLFDFGVFKGQTRAAQAEVRAGEVQIALLNQQAAARIEIARVQIQTRRDQAARYQTQILPLTLDLLRKTQIGYAQGASTYLEVLEAQRTTRQIQSEYLQALVGVQNGETALDAAINGGFETLETLAQPALRGDDR